MINTALTQSNTHISFYLAAVQSQIKREKISKKWDKTGEDNEDEMVNGSNRPDQVNNQSELVI